MGKSVKDQLEMAKNRRELVKVKVQEKLLNRKLAVLNKYDAVDANNSKKRRNPNVETSKEEEILPARLRNKGIAMTRDLERNYTNAKSMVRQVKINTVGRLGKLRVNTDDVDANTMVQDWFNSTYAKNCDARGDNHLSDFFKLSIVSTLREGDVLAVFDDFKFDDGKLLFFEADQFVKIKESDWKIQTEWVETVKGADGKEITRPLQQESGIIYDTFGRVIAYAVSGSKRGVESVAYEDAMIIPRGSAKHLMMPWRFNQLRGSADMLTMVADMEDNYEMRAKELQTAKVAATMAGKVTRKDGVEDAMVATGLDPDEIIEDDADTGAQKEEETIYDNFGHLTGGNLEYMDDGDEFEFFKIDRPNLDAAKFHDFMLQSSGSAIGLARAYSLLQADRSYTAFRGEMVMSWESFYDYQKWLERRLADWVAVKAITYAIKAKTLSVKLADNWQSKISWQWPVMPQVDPVKENKGKETGLKNGLTDYSEIHGPEWKKRFAALAEQKEEAERLGLSLEAFAVDAVPGAMNMSIDDLMTHMENLITTMKNED